MIDVLALKHGDNPDDAAQVACRLMTAAGYKRVTAANLAAAAKRRRAELVKNRPPVPPAGLTVRAVLPDAPVGDAVVVPPGYSVGPNGVVGPDGNPFAPRPVVLTETGRDEQSGDRTVTLAWGDGQGGWESRTVPRAVIADAKQVVALAASGFPVTSNSARDVVGYLAAFESANVGTLPAVGVSRRLGWQRDRTGFLCGPTYITADRRTGPADRRDRVVFRGADVGDDQVAAGFHAHGDMAGWRAAVAPVGIFPVAVFVLYAALTPVLLEILRVANFVVSLAGETSTGKSTALRVAASLWGCPDDRRPPTVVRNFNSTVVSKDRTAAVTGDLPLFFDETQTASKDEDVRNMVYAVCQGQAKVRGTTAGLAASPAISTVLFMTGEKPATAFSEEGEPALGWSGSGGRRSPGPPPGRRWSAI